MELNYVLKVVLQADFFATATFEADFLTATFLPAAFLVEVFLAVFLTATFFTAATADFAATFLVAVFLAAAFLAGAFLVAAFRPRAGFFDGPAARRATRSAIASSSVTASAVTDRGQRGVGLSVRHVGAEAAGLDHDGLAEFRILSERSAGIGGAATETAAVFLRDDEIDGAVAADLQHVVVIAEIGVGLAVLDIGAIAADAGDDRLARNPGAARPRAAGRAASARSRGRSRPAERPFGSDERFGFSPSPSCTKGPKRPSRSVTCWPVSGSSPSTRTPGAPPSSEALALAIAPVTRAGG